VSWLKGSWHHVPASKIALGAALLAMLPRIGALGLEDLRRVGYLLLFFVASVVSMGRVLTAAKSLDVFTQVPFGWITPLIGHTCLAPFALFWIGFVYRLFLASGISMLGTSIPGLMTYAAAHHLNPLALGMVWTFSSARPSSPARTPCLSWVLVRLFHGQGSASPGAVFEYLDSLLLLIVVLFYWPLIGTRY
jgi:hypothetical protein